MVIQINKANRIGLKIMIELGNVHRGVRHIQQETQFKVEIQSIFYDGQRCSRSKNEAKLKADCIF